MQEEHEYCTNGKFNLKGLFICCLHNRACEFVCDDAEIDYRQMEIDAYQEHEEYLCELHRELNNE